MKSFKRFSSDCSVGFWSFRFGYRKLLKYTLTELYTLRVYTFFCFFFFGYTFFSLSWAKDMNVIPCFCEAFPNAGTPSQFLRLSVRLFIFLFLFLYFCLAHFTLLVYKSLIMVVQNFQKYHWIQHKNAQPLVIMTKRNKLLWTSEASESVFN